MKEHIEMIIIVEKTISAYEKRLEGLHNKYKILNFPLEPAFGVVDDDYFYIAFGKKIQGGQFEIVRET